VGDRRRHKSITSLVWLLVSVSLASQSGCHKSKRYPLQEAPCLAVWGVRVHTGGEETSFSTGGRHLLGGLAAKITSHSVLETNEHEFRLSLSSVNAANEDFSLCLVSSNANVQMGMKPVDGTEFLLLQGDLRVVTSGTRLILLPGHKEETGLTFEAGESVSRWAQNKFTLLVDTSTRTIHILTQPVAGWRNTATGRKISWQEREMIPGSLVERHSIIEEDSKGAILRRLGIIGKSFWTLQLLLSSNGTIAFGGYCESLQLINGQPDFVKATSWPVFVLISKADGTPPGFGLINHANLVSDGWVVMGFMPDDSLAVAMTTLYETEYSTPALPFSIELSDPGCLTILMSASGVLEQLLSVGTGKLWPLNIVSLSNNRILLTAQAIDDWQCDDFEIPNNMEADILFMLKNVQ